MKGENQWQKKQTAGRQYLGAFAQLSNHMELAKKNGVTKEEIVEIITQLAFYVGWPNAWSAFQIAKKVWND